MRLRRDGKSGSCITVSIKNTAFHTYAHLRQLSYTVNGTQALYQAACQALDEVGTGKCPCGSWGCR